MLTQRCSANTPSILYQNRTTCDRGLKVLMLDQDTDNTAYIVSNNPFWRGNLSNGLWSDRCSAIDQHSRRQAWRSIRHRDGNRRQQRNTFQSSLCPPDLSLGSRGARWVQRRLGAARHIRISDSAVPRIVGPQPRKINGQRPAPVIGSCQCWLGNQDRASTAYRHPSLAHPQDCLRR